MPARPNILIFMTDQQRGASLTGPNRAITPNIDRFRKEGLTFTNAFCPSPHCCPSRASFLSGRYPSEHGVWNNVGVGNALSRGLASGIRLWSEDLRDDGYAMRYCGKWHVSVEENPEDRGWTEGVVTACHAKGTPPLPQDYEWEQYERVRQPAERGEGVILRPGYSPYSHYGLHEDKFNDRVVVADAARFLETYEGEAPWCLYVGTLGPHDPYFVPRRFLDRYDAGDIKLPASFSDKMTDKPALYRRTRDRFDQLSEAEHRESIRHYLAFCSYQDELFGQVLETLQARGDAENTLVVYLSDHGDYLADHGLWCKGLPCFRGAYEIPAVIRWPAGLVKPGRTVDRFVSLIDFYPTFLEATGRSSCPGHLQGSSLMPFIEDRAPVGWRDAVFTQSNGNELYGIQRSVMTDEWKLVYNGFDYDELYDLKNDPDETVNLIDRPGMGAVIRALYKRLWTFARDNHDACVNQYIMVALAKFGPGVVFEDDPVQPTGASAS